MVLRKNYDQREEATSSMRSFAKNAALLACSVVAMLLALEGGVRLYAALWYPRMMQLDYELGWKHTPNARKIFVNEVGEHIEVVQNEYGHRGPARPRVKDPTKYRILVLGDSFTEAVHVSEHDVFTARLERANPGVEVLNAGVGGYGTVQEYLYLESAGLSHQPDLVLLMVYDNDFADNCLSAYPGFGPKPYAVRNGGTVEIVRHPDDKEFLKYALPVPFAVALSKHSHLFYFLNTNIYQRLRASHMTDLQKADLKRTDACGREEVMWNMLERMQRLTASHGSRFAVVLIPTREQVQQGKAPALQSIASRCEHAAIACLHLLDVLGHGSQRPQAYFPTDIHWTTAGHRLAAEEIERFLRGRALLAPSASPPGKGTSASGSPSSPVRRAEG